MAKNDNNVLALPPLKSEFSPTANTSIVPHAGGRAQEKRERQIIEISNEQRIVMEHTSYKAQLGMVMVEKIQEQGIHTFSETAAYILEIKNQPGRDTELQTYINQFSLRQTQILAQQVLGIIDVAGTGIGMEVHRPLYPEREEPTDRPGFFRRIFG